MKRIFAVFVVFCMLAIYAVLPVSAAMVSHSVVELDESQQSDVISALEVSIDEEGSSIIMPLNTDMVQVSGPYWQGSVINVPRGKALKVHVYIESYAIASNSVTVYAKSGSAAGTKDSKYKIATWSGIGHHWATIDTNTSNSTYYVMLWGAFNGSGAVYIEP